MADTQEFLDEVLLKLSNKSRPLHHFTEKKSTLYEQKCEQAIKEAKQAILQHSQQEQDRVVLEAKSTLGPIASEGGKKWALVTVRDLLKSEEFNNQDLLPWVQKEIDKIKGGPDEIS